MLFILAYIYIIGMKHIHITYAIFIMLFPVALFAQDTMDEKKRVSGQIINETGEPLAGANIWFVNKADTLNKQGTSTDKEGLYSLRVDAGEYEIRVSYIGYATYVSQVQAYQDMKLPAIALDVASEELGMVTITGRSVTYNLNGYKASINQNPIFKPHTMDKVLPMLPGVGKNSVGLTLYNMPVGALYVNGRRIKISEDEIESYLKSFSGSDIKEVRLQAGGGVESGSGSVGRASLFITTNRVENGGRMLLAYNADVGKYRRSLYNPRLNLDLNYGKLSASVSASNFSYNNEAIPTSSESRFYDSESLIRSEIYTKGKMKYSMNYNLTLWYDFSANDRLMVDALYKGINRNGTGWTITDTYRSGKREQTEHVSSSSSFEYTASSATVGYVHQWRSGNVLLQADYNRRGNDEVQQMETESEVIREKKNMLSDRTTDLYSATVRATQKVGGWNGVLKFGSSFSYLDADMNSDNKYTDGEGNFIVPGTFTDMYNYREKVLGVYGGYTVTPVSQLSLAVGLRYEYVYRSPKSAVNPERNKSNRLNELYPQFRLNYVINQAKGHNLNLMYARQSMRPDMRMLNPAIEWESEYAYRTGNPYLEPASYDNLLAVFTLFGNYSLSAMYTVSDEFQHVYRKDAEKDCFYSTYENGGKSRECSVGLSAPFVLPHGVMLSPGINYLYNYRKFGETSLRNHSWNASLNAMASLPWDISSSFMFTYNSASEQIGIRTSEFILASLSFQKSFFKRRLSVDIGLDYFSPVDSRNSGEGFVFNSYGNKKDALKGTLHLSYTLGWGKKVKIKQKENFNNELKRLKE